MKNKLDTASFDYNSFQRANHVEKLLKSSYDEIEQCCCSPLSPYRCFKGNKMFVVNPNGTLLSTEPFDAFDVYGKNFFVGKQGLKTTDCLNSPNYKYIIFDFQLNVLCVSTREPNYLGWRIIACESEHDGFRLFNPYGEIKCDYNIRDIRKFGENTHFGTANANSFFSIFEITEQSTYRGLYGLLNIYGEVALEPKYDIIEFDNKGNIKASLQKRTYNGEWQTVFFDNFLHTTPAFLLQYKSFNALSDSLYSVSNNENKEGVVNNHNTIVLPFEFEYIYKTNNGLAIFKKNNENGVIRLYDKKIIVSSSQYNFDICHGEILCRSHGRYTLFCNIANTQIEWYDKIVYLFDNYFKVQKYHHYGIIDSNGEKIINVDYERIIVYEKLILLVEGNVYYPDEEETGCCFPINDYILGDNITILSKDFTPLIDGDIDIKSIKKTEISTYIIESSAGFGVLDTDFNIMIPPIFEKMYYSEGEYISEKGKHSLDGRFVFEDDETIKIIDLNYSYCEPINEQYFVCLNRPYDIYNYRNYKYGVLDINFKEVIPMIYKKILSTFQNSLFIVHSFNNKCGVINANNEIVIPISFDSIASNREIINY